MRLHALTAVVLGLLTTTAGAVDPDYGLKPGAPDLKSAGALAFGPADILFIGDQKGAAIFAVATGDKATTGAKPVNVEGFSGKIAAMLGTTPDKLIINDIAVRRESGTVYVSVSRGRGPDAMPIVLRVGADGKISELELKNVPFAKAAIPNAPEDKEIVGRRGRKSNPRTSSITDLAYFDNSVYVAGISNEEFASNLRSIDFPFTTVGDGTTVEIYHGAHGAYETNAPVRTLMPFEIGGEPHLLAAYTCTPLVVIPVQTLRSVAQTRGRTVAELGNRNRPLDMIVYEKDGMAWLLLANSARGMMKITTEGIESMEGITERVARGGRAGLTYETIEDLEGVVQMDKFDDENAIVLVKTGDMFHLKTVALP
jgi:hypothetical protein